MQKKINLTWLIKLIVAVACLHLIIFAMCWIATGLQAEDKTYYEFWPTYKVLILLTVHVWKLVVAALGLCLLILGGDYLFNNVNPFK